MLQEAAVTDLKSISAAKRPNPSGRSIKQRRSKRDAANILWRRITAAYDEEVARFAKNPALVAPITRWVLFNHLTVTQGMAARRYADIMRNFKRYHTEDRPTSPRSANLEPTRGVEDQELQRRILSGTIEDYEDEARYTKRQYKRVMKVLARFADPISGRNFAKDSLDMLCVEDREPPAEHRKDIGAVLTAIAKEFGIGEKREKR